MGLSGIRLLIAAGALAFAGAPAAAFAAAGETTPAAQASPDARETPQIIMRSLTNASNRIKAVTGRPVLVEAPDFGPEAAPFVARAADLTAQAFERDYRARSGLAMNLIKRVIVTESAKAKVELRGSELLLFVAPRKGAAGLPTLDAIGATLAAPTLRLTRGTPIARQAAPEPEA